MLFNCLLNKKSLQKIVKNRFIWLASAYYPLRLSFIECKAMRALLKREAFF